MASLASFFHVIAFCPLIHIANLLLHFSLSVSANDSPYCDQVLGEKKLVVKTSASLHNEIPEFYEVFATKKITFDTCEIDHDHGIRISLERITRISDIFIEDTAILTDPRAIEAALWRAGTQFHCRFSMKRLHYSNHTFLDYACFDENIYNGTGIFANAVEIKSAIALSLNVTNFKRQQPLGWLVPAQLTNENHALLRPGRCSPPGLYPDQTIENAKGFYPANNKLAIQCWNTRLKNKPPDIQRLCGEDGNWSPSRPPMCRPWEPYSRTYNGFSDSAPGPGMRNVSQIFSFNQDLFNISMIGLDFGRALSKSEARRTLPNNVNCYIMNSTTVVHSFINVVVSRLIATDEVKDYFTHIHDTTTPMYTRIVVDECLDCSVRITFPVYHWDYWIVEKFYLYASPSRENTEYYRQLSKECPPIDAYPGMPPAYAEYDLVRNGSINGLLRQSPCRPGFKVSGNNRNGINQCENGNWIGEGFPTCHLIRSKNPPDVNGTTWRYVHDDLFHEIQYTCTNNNLRRNGSDDWHVTDDLCREISPRSRINNSPPELPTDSLPTDNWHYIIMGIAIPAAVVIITLAGAIVVLKRKKKRRDEAHHRAGCTSSSSDRTTTEVTPYNDGYVLPRNDAKQDPGAGVYLTPRTGRRQYQHQSSLTAHTATGYCYDDVGNDAHIYEEIDYDRVRGDAHHVSQTHQTR